MLAVSMKVYWSKVEFKDEIGEFVRTVEFFTPDKKEYKTNLKLLEESYRKAPMVNLTDTDWRKMQNTDSWLTDTLLKLYDAIKRNREPRNVNNVEKEFSAGKVRAPIAIRLKNNILYLVAGNTRLMIARMLNIRPKVVIIETDW